MADLAAAGSADPEAASEALAPAVLAGVAADPEVPMVARSDQ